MQQSSLPRERSASTSSDDSSQNLGDDLAVMSSTQASASDLMAAGACNNSQVPQPKGASAPTSSRKRDHDHMANPFAHAHNAGANIAAQASGVNQARTSDVSSQPTKYQRIQPRDSGNGAWQPPLAPGLAASSELDDDKKRFLEYMQFCQFKQWMIDGRPKHEQVSQVSNSMPGKLTLSNADGEQEQFQNYFQYLQFQIWMADGMPVMPGGTPRVNMPSTLANLVGNLGPACPVQEHSQTTIGPSIANFPTPGDGLRQRESHAAPSVCLQISFMLPPHCYRITFVDIMHSQLHSHPIPQSTTRPRMPRTCCCRTTEMPFCLGQPRSERVKICLRSCLHRSMDSWLCPTATRRLAKSETCRNTSCSKTKLIPTAARSKPFSRPFKASRLLTTGMRLPARRRSRTSRTCLPRSSKSSPRRWTSLLERTSTSLEDEALMCEGSKASLEMNA